MTDVSGALVADDVRAAEAQAARMKKIIAALVALLILLGIGGLIWALSGGDDSTGEAPAVTLSETEIFNLQQACFASVPPLFFDEQGKCFSQDPTGLTDAQKAPFFVAAPGQAAAPDPAAPAAAPGAPAAPASPVNPAAPVAPAATPAPAAPTTAAAAATPAPPTTKATAAAPAAPTTTTATAAPTTAATATAGLTIGNPASAWVVALSPPPPVGYTTVEECRKATQPNEGCKRLRDGSVATSVTVYFGVIDGVVAGNATNGRLSSSGQMKTGAGTQINSNILNSAGEIQNLYEFNGQAGGGCTFSGQYRYLKASGPDPQNDIGGSQSEFFKIPGNFTMKYQGPSCPT